MRSWPKLEIESRLPHWGDGQNDSLVLVLFLCSHGYRYGCYFVISWDTSVMQIDDEQALPGGLVQGNGAAKQTMLSSVLHGVHHRLVRAALYPVPHEICQWRSTTPNRSHRHRQLCEFSNRQNIIFNSSFQIRLAASKSKSLPSPSSRRHRQALGRCDTFTHRSRTEKAALRRARPIRRREI